MKKSKKITKIIKLIVIVLFLCVLLIGGYLAFNGKSEIELTLDQAGINEVPKGKYTLSCLENCEDVSIIVDNTTTYNFTDAKSYANIKVKKQIEMPDNLVIQLKGKGKVDNE